MSSLALYKPPRITRLIKASDSSLMTPGTLNLRSNKVFERISPKWPGLSVPAMEYSDFIIWTERVDGITKYRLRTVTTQGFIYRLTIPLKTSQNPNKSVKFHRTYPKPYQILPKINWFALILVFRKYIMELLSVSGFYEIQCPAFYNDILC